MSVQKARLPSVLVAVEPELVAVAPHPDDDRAEAGPRVEPSVEHGELAPPVLEEREAEGGDEKCAALIGHFAGRIMLDRLAVIFA